MLGSDRTISVSILGERTCCVNGSMGDTHNFDRGRGCRRLWVTNSELSIESEDSIWRRCGSSWKRSK